MNSSTQPIGAIAAKEPAVAVSGDVGSLTPLRVGMLAFLASEVAFFSTLIVAYLTFLGRDRSGPTPAEALSLPLALGSSLFLFASSVSIHRAEKSLHLGSQSGFHRWWGATIALGVIFLLGTAYEWSELIRVHRLTISTNLFGSTYYTLVGFHGLHVACGLLAMSIVLCLSLRNRIGTESVRAPGRKPSAAIEVVSWYWHFVDAVWVVVFGIVYLIGR
jgi:cytochrome c oxidase subunit 3